MAKKKPARGDASVSSARSTVSGPSRGTAKGSAAAAKMAATEAVEKLAVLGYAMEFVKDQYRHCKPILAFGASRALLEGAGIFATLPSGEKDPGVLLCEEGNVTKAVAAFTAAIARHRHFERETLPPRV